MRIMPPTSGFPQADDRLDLDLSRFVRGDPR